MRPACWAFSSTGLQQQLASSISMTSSLLCVGGCTRCTRQAAVCCLLCTQQCPSPYQCLPWVLQCSCLNWLRPGCNPRYCLSCMRQHPAVHLCLPRTPAVPLGWTDESLAARRNPFNRLVRPGTVDAGAAGPSIRRGLFAADVAPQHSALHLEVGPQPVLHSYTRTFL